MIGEYEEDFDDFPTFSAENINRQAECMVGAYRAESDDQWTDATGITTKIPPLFGGPTSWFKSEELIDDWLYLTVHGDAEMYKGLLDRESLEAEDGVKYFRDTLRPHFIIRAKRGNIEMIKWIGKFALLLKRLRDASPGV